MVELIKGQFYGKYGGKKNELKEIYLIGANVPCITNVYAGVVYKDGRMRDDVEAIYHRQNDNFRLLPEKDVPKIKASYRRHVQNIMMGTGKYLNTKNNSDLLDVGRFLDDPNAPVPDRGPAYMVQASDEIRRGLKPTDYTEWLNKGQKVSCSTS